jgi:hypothetical protein
VLVILGCEAASGMPIAGINITEDVLYAFAGLLKHENARFWGGGRENRQKN